MYLKDHSRRIIVGGSHDLNILIIKKLVQYNKKLYVKKQFNMKIDKI